MGNSGSVHHMQPGLKELHSYHQVQKDGGYNDGNDNLTLFNNEPQENFQQNFLERGVLDKSLHKRSQFTRIPSSSNRLNQNKATVVADVKNSHVKVLPSLSENLKLRSTTNGAILQSGGTISGRRESLIHQPLERSRTFITETSEECLKNNASRMMMKRRSQTQLSIDLRKNGCNRNEVPEQNVHHKRFSSNLDLRSMINDNLENDPNASVCNSSESYQKLSKVKIKNKKRKAPPVPLEIPLIHQQNIDFDRKQRLFKTKNETTVQGSTINQSKPQPMTSKPSQQLASPVMMRSTYKSNLNPGFRREKSFDAKLLSSMSKNADQMHREVKPFADTNKRKSFQVARTTAPMAKPVKNTDSYLKEKEDKSDLKIELEDSSKFRLMLKKSSTNARDSKPRQREPNNAKPKLPAPLPKVPKPETQSKIPQLKKTFYFGMESSKRKTSVTNIGDSSQKIVNLLSSSYDDEKLLKDEIVLNKHLTTLSKDNDPVYTLNHKYDTETNDNGIQVNVRPTLPRRQLEIPRFSPVAAWRTLSEEYRKQSNNVEATASNMPETSSNIEATNSLLIEDRIHRTYREPGSFYPDNKSGDSGISGDDGYIVEKPIQPRNIVQGLRPDCCDELANLENGYPVMQELVPSPLKVVGPFLKPWTPQQDLEEEESSSDGGGDVAIKPTDAQSPTSPHLFSLSLPRENQLSVYGEKNKPDFRSLQKLKQTASGDLNGSNFDCNQSSDSHNMLDGVDVCLGNYRSDNWVLSKTAMTIANTPAPLNNDPDGCHKNNKGSYFDMSISMQPISLGSLATGKHVMYLPNRLPSENERQSVRPPNTNLINNRERMMEESFCKNISIPMRNKRFSFQSSVRQIERRRLSEKLSKEADQKEALRKSELEAMRRVEEEFQRKRAYEKASIRHQLRLYSMDDDNFSSLPNLSGLRAEPDGAVSSASESPVLQINARKNFKYHSSNRVATSNDLAMIFANS